MTIKNGTTIHLQAVAMKDPGTGWIEICKLHPVQADLVTNQVKLAWLTRYPLPRKVIVDKRNEFLTEFETMIKADYGTKKTLLLQETHKLILY